MHRPKGAANAMGSTISQPTIPRAFLSICPNCSPKSPPPDDSSRARAAFALSSEGTSAPSSIILPKIFAPKFIFSGELRRNSPSPKLKTPVQ
jgi:hypothetical protein